MAEAFFSAELAVGARGKIRIEVSQDSRSSSADNYSLVTVRGYIGLSSGGPSADSTGNCKSSFAGTNSYGPVTTNFSALYASEGWRLMLSQTFTVPHNADGTKSVSYTYKFGPTITTNLGSGGSVTAGGSLWTIPRAPSTPAAPTLTYIPPTTIKANGVAPAANGSPIEWYHFLIDTNNPPQDGSPNFRTVSGGSNPSATITGLSLDTTYYINFAARNSHGWGGRSPASMLSIGGVPGKPAVTNVELSPPNRLVIAYSAPASQGGSTITHYSLSYHKAGQSATPAYVSNIGKTGSYTLAVDPGYDYYVQVAAVNSQGTGEYSSAFGPTNVYAGPKARYTIGGTSSWRDSECYVRHAGVWKPAMAYVRHAGVWKPLTT